MKDFLSPFRLKLTLFFALGTLLFTISGCGIGIERNSGQIDEDGYELVKPFSASLYDKSCQLDPQENRPPEFNRLFIETTFGTLWTRECANKTCTGLNGRENVYHLKATERQLNICGEFEDFPRLSYESVAVQAQRSLQSAFQHFELWLPSREIPKIQLSIFPEFRSNHSYPDQKEFSSWKVNNLAYFTKSQKIAIYPAKTGPEKRGKYLWESEFIFAHEFAHHVEQNISSNQSFTQLGDLGTGSQPEKEIWSGHPTLRKQKKNDKIIEESQLVHASGKSSIFSPGSDLSNRNRSERGLQRKYGLNHKKKTKRKHRAGPRPRNRDSDIFSIQGTETLSRRILGGFSEGFADLLAFYSVEERTDSLENLLCFETSRSVSNGSFTDNKSKILTSEISSSLMKDIQQKTLCGEAIPATKHTLGSILAFQANKAFSIAVEQLYADKSAIEKVGIKYRLTIRWMTDFYSGFRGISNFETSTLSQILYSLKKSITEMVERNLSTDSLQTADIMGRVCGSLHSGFPEQEICAAARER